MNKTINFGAMRLKKRSIKYTETILLFFIWLVVFLSPIFVSDSTDSINWKHIVGVWIRFAPFVILSLINHFVLVPKLFYRYKTGYFVAVVLLLMALSYTFTLLPNHRLDFNQAPMEDGFLPPNDFPAPPKMRPQNSQREMPTEMRDLPPHQRPEEMPLWLNTLLIGILILGFDTGLRITFKWNKTEQEKTQLEKEKVKSELAFLKNQLSPHFFMNTLNNIHSLIDIDTEEAKESIIQLSKLMRHLLYDSDEELIPLSKEVQFIQSYVDLMKLRFTEKVKVSFAIESENNNLSIPPLLFTSLIENAFKYGVSYKQDSFIHIELSTKDQLLRFLIQNSKIDTKSSGENEASGIGLENTRKRLDLLYASNYEMNIYETVTTFSVELKLPL